MKRTADEQLTKDSADNEIEEISGPGDFRRADKTELAGRTIRGLPKRSLSNTPMLDQSMDQDKTSNVSFGAFGSASNSAFTFSAPTSSTPVKAPATTPMSFNFSSSSSPFGATSTSTPSSGVTSASPMPNGSFSHNQATAPHANGVNGDDAAVKYHKSLRGLNISLNAAIGKALESDPFFDASSLFERYKTLRGEIQKEFDNQPKPATNLPNGTTPPASMFGSSTPKPSGPSIPLHASGPTFPFSGFGKTPASESANSSGFTPTVPSSSGNASSSFFATPPERSSSSNPLIPSSSVPIFSASTSTSTPDAGSKPGTSSSPFSSQGSGETRKPLFGGTTGFGAGASAAKFDVSSTPATPSFSVSSSSTPTPSTSIFGAPAKSPFGNSVGFSFGSPTPEPEALTTQGVAASRSSSVVMVDQDAKTSSAQSEASRGVTPATTDGGDMEETPRLIGANPHDEEGEGEQDEETTHVSRVKVYKMGQKDGKPAWTEVGVGMVRVKKHKETGARRLLSRNSSTGRIMINFKLYPSLKTTRAKQAVSFVGHEDGKQATFRLRLKDEAAAIALKEAIDAEVAAISS